MKKSSGFFLSLTILLSLLNGCAPVSIPATPGASTQHSPQDTITQLSTIDALSNGLYEGFMSAAEVLKYGDFGLGTFEGLDGEMVIIDGKMYQIPFDGATREVEPAQLIPFMAITYFESDQEHSLSAGTDMKTFIADVSAKLQTQNIFYAVKIEGTFQGVKTRSVPEQIPPYPPLADAVQKQAVFDFTDIEGTMVGFWCPAYVAGINVPGFHLHFLTKDGKSGGHVLDFTAQAAVVKLDLTNDFTMILPSSPAFYEMDFTANE